MGLKLLECQGDRFSNTPAAHAYLTSHSDQRMTGYINYSNRVMWSLWANLEDAIREGTHRWKQLSAGTAHLRKPVQNRRAMREFLMGMHGFGMMTSPQVVSALDLSRFKQLVDLGGATGHLAIAACKRYSSMQATVFDLPQAIRWQKRLWDRPKSRTGFRFVQAISLAIRCRQQTCTGLAESCMTGQRRRLKCC